MKTTNTVVMEFSDFFQQVTGFAPFAWQSRMVEEIAVQRRWPDQIALPTGVGKSSVVTIWAYALAMDLLATEKVRHIPLRLIYVVDRRIIVDAVDQQAQAIATLLAQSEVPGIRNMAAALRPYPEAPALQVARARGGVPPKHLWTRAPSQPTILTSTVDQAGSRLLFRGYGISAGQQSIHAGLMGIDSLFLLDEAHLSTPFVQTLAAIRDVQREREAAAGLLPLSLVTMSATLPESGNGWVFSLRSVEAQELADRLRRPKWMTMPRFPLPANKVSAEIGGDEAASEANHQEKESTQSAHAGDDFFVNRSQLQSAILTQVARITKDLGSGIGAVVVNHVATARALFTALKKNATYDKAETGNIRDVVLLTGRIRGYDRDALLRRWLPQMQAQRAADAAGVGVVWVVATQTIEVGADFDFDALITECAPLPALRQRLGRLNRLGRVISAVGNIVRPEHAKGIYSDAAVRATWDWLSHPVSCQFQRPMSDEGLSTLPSPFNVASPTVADTVIINGSSAALDEEIAQKPPTGTEDQPLDAPILLLPHIQAWSQTRPKPIWESDITPFLHGKQTRMPDVHVVWRRDLKQDLLLRASQNEELESQIADFLSWVPPVNGESLDIPVWAVREWLGGVAVQPLLADFDSTAMDAVDPHPKQGQRRMAWRLDKSRVNPPRSTRKQAKSSAIYVVAPEDIRPGDTILVPADYGGTDAWGLDLWSDARKAPAPVTDVGDLASVGQHRRHLRLTPDLLQAGFIPGVSTDVPWRSTFRDLMALTDSDTPRADFRAALDQWLQLVMPLVTPEMQSVIRECRDYLPSTAWQVYPDALGPGIVVLWYAEAGAETLDDADDATNCLGDQPGLALPTLQAHQDAVAAWVDLYTKHGLVPTHLAEIARWAGKYHDLGKLDPRFQLMMHGGDAVAMMADTEPVAKSNMDPRDRQAFTRAQQSAKYPQGQRHEELSVRLAQSMDFEGMDRDHLPLLWHLIGTHHGWGRPWFPANEDPEPVTIATMYQGQQVQGESTPSLGQLNAGWVDQFEQLQARYGFWGLAYLESIVRLADYQASATKGGPQ